MPRDRSAALAAWAKRKRASPEAAIAAAQATLEAHQRADKSHERMIMVDAKTGAILQDQTGEAHRIDAHVIPPRGTTIVDMHTHPNESSMSDGDWKRFSALSEFIGVDGEMRVVAESNIFTLRATPAYEAMDWKKRTPRATEERWNQIFDEHTAVPGGWDVNRVLDLVNAQMAKEFGVSFTITPRTAVVAKARDRAAALKAWEKRRRAKEETAPFKLAGPAHVVTVGPTRDSAWSAKPQGAGLHDLPINSAGNLTVEGHGKKKRGRAGDVAESVGVAILNDLKRFGHVSRVLPPEGGNNSPVDAVGDHHVIELKGGSISNDRKSRQWRVTNGQTTKTEIKQFAIWRKQGKKGAAKLRAYNEQKRQDAMTRKREIAAKVGKQLVTIGVIINHEKRVADVYMFTGVEKRISWDDARVKGKGNGRGSAYLTSRAYKVEGL